MIDISGISGRNTHQHNNHHRQLVKRKGPFRESQLPAPTRRTYEGEYAFVRERKIPEWFGLACLATLCLCIGSLLTEGIKQARLMKDLDGAESTGRILTLVNKNVTSFLMGNTDYYGIQQDSKRHTRGDQRQRQQQQQHDAVLASEDVGDKSQLQQQKIAPNDVSSQNTKVVYTGDNSILRPIQRRILALGGSTTWGAKLDSRSEAFPTVLSTLLGPEWTTVNVAIRATGASLPSQCIQTMIQEAESASANNNDNNDTLEFDIILLEYSLNGLRNLNFLVKRLRRRYPNAMFVYVDLYAFRMNIQDSTNQAKPRDVLKQGLKAKEADELISKMILDTPNSNWIWSEAMINFSQKTYLEALDIVSQVDGYMYGLPMPQAPAEAMAWFGHDFHHLNAVGHRRVAMGLHQLLKSVKADATPKCRSGFICDSTWGKGDSCFSWFETGETPHLTINGGKMLEFAPSKYALHVGGRFGNKATVTFPNTFSEQQPMEISYMSWKDPSFYPKFQATLTSESGKKSTSVLVDPINPEVGQRIYHITVSRPLGWVEPGRNILTIEPTETKEFPVRLIGIILCGACAEMNYTSAG